MPLFYQISELLIEGVKLDMFILVTGNAFPEFWSLDVADPLLQIDNDFYWHLMIT